MLLYVTLALCTLLAGLLVYRYDLLRMGIPGSVRTLLGCVAVSTALHFFWDWISLSARDAPDLSWWQKLSAMFLVLWGCLFYGVLVITGSRWSRAVFAPRGRASLWGWPFSLWRPERQDAPAASREREREPESTLER